MLFVLYLITAGKLIQNVSLYKINTSLIYFYSCLLQIFTTFICKKSINMLKYNIVLVFTIIFLLAYNKVESQDALGLNTDNYRGIWSATINPALLTQNKTYLDINIFGTSFHFSNNFAYIPSSDPIFFGPFPIDTLTPTYDYGEFSYNKYFTYYKNNKIKWGFINFKSLGPSAMFQYGDNAFGFSSALRSSTSATKIPWEIPVFIYEDISYHPLRNIPFSDEDFGTTQLIWEEFSFSYAHILYDKLGKTISLGVSLKFLFGLAGMYNVYNTADYSITDTTTISFDKLDTDIGIAFPENNINMSLINPLNSLGFGIGTDIGITYIHKKNTLLKYKNKRPCETPFEDYNYRIGISLLDIGNIRFNKNSNLYNIYTKNTDFNTSDLDTLTNLSVEQSMKYLSYLLTGDADSSFVKNNISIGLPTAVSLQFDWHPEKSFYISGIIVQPLHFSMKNATRPAQISIIPRYETRIFTAGIPISMLQYHIPRVGLFLRIYNLTIGTESLGTLLDINNLDNLDIYFSLKIFLEKGKCNPCNIDGCYKKHK
jgi:hypothetical protein